jgi:hypothetical protein
MKWELRLDNKVFKVRINWARVKIIPKNCFLHPFEEKMKVDFAGL